MNLIIRKYGGTSVVDVPMIKRVANKIIDDFNSGKNIVVILSAMAGITDNLIKLALQASNCPDKRELDVILATGEFISVALLTIIIKHRGYSAKSLVAHQIGIITNSLYGNAKILDVDIRNINKILKNRVIAVVAGFQGCDIYGNITTLGRGGSDITALIISASLGFESCEISKDVDAVYTIDPNFSSKARKMDNINYDMMFKMARLGNQVLHYDSIKFARDYAISINIVSSFLKNTGSYNIGTLIGNNIDDVICFETVGVICDLNTTSIFIRGIFYKSNILSKLILLAINNEIFSNILFEKSVMVDKINIIFIVLKDNLEEAFKIIENIKKNTNIISFIKKIDTVKISLLYFKNNFIYLLNCILKALDKEKIKIMRVNVSRYDISFCIREKYFNRTIDILCFILKL